MAVDKTKLILNPLAGSYDTVQDVSGLLPKDGSESMTGSLDMGANSINNVPTVNSTSTLNILASNQITVKTDNQASFSNSSPVTIATGSHSNGDTGDINLSTGAVANAGFFRGKVNVFADSLNMNSKKIKDLADPTDPQDAVTMAYVLANATAPGANTTLSNLTSPIAVNQSILPDSGGSRSLGSAGYEFYRVFASILTFPNNAGQIQGFGGDVYVEPLGLDGNVFISPNGSGSLNLGNKKITNVANPTNPQDVATKAYVLANAGASGANQTLSNLTAPTVINQDLLPAGDADGRALGTTAKRWTFLNTIFTYTQSLFITDSSSNVKGFMGAGSSNLSGISFSGNRIGSSGEGAGNGMAMITDGIFSTNQSSPIFIATGQNAGAGNSGNVTLLTGTVATGIRGKINVLANTMDMNSTKIVNLATPTAPGDAASKAYVDASAGGGGATALNRDGTNTITGALRADTANTRNFGLTTNAFSTGYFNSLKQVDGGNSADFNTGILTSAFGFDTVNWQSRKLVSGTVTAAAWGNGGLEMYDIGFNVARDIIGLGKYELVSGANLKNVIVNSNRTAVIAAAGTGTISLSSTRGAIVDYRIFRSVGGTETRTGTIRVAKETVGSNVNSAVNDVSVSTNVTMDSVILSINASGNLLITNNTTFSVEARIVLTALQ